MAKRTSVLVILTLMALILLGLPASAGANARLLATPIGSFPEWVNFYGFNSTFNGLPLPVGAEVVAYAGDKRCGSFVVHTAGSYGLLPCYREQVGQPGAQPGDRIRFTINGFEAILRGPDEPIWTSNGDRKHVELEASGAPQTATGTATRTVMPTSTPTHTPPVPPTQTFTPVVPPTATPITPPAPTPTFTVVIPPTVPPAATATPIPPSYGYCRETITDGGFEAGGYWTIDPAPRAAARTTSIVHAGSYAMRLGIDTEINIVQVHRAPSQPPVVVNVEV